MAFGFLNFLKTSSEASSHLPAIKADPELLKKHVQELSNISPPRSYLHLQSLNKIAHYIRSTWQAQGLHAEFQNFTAGGKTYKNVLTSLGPKSGPRIVVGAHYDSAGDTPGADDNASGVAGILELGRMLQKDQHKLKYRVDLVAYCLEEPPFFASHEMGSSVHAKSLKDHKIDVKLMLSLEMIGYFLENENTQHFPIESLKHIYPSTGNFIAVVGRMDSVWLTKKVKDLMKENSEIDVHFINAPEAVPGVGLSDHRSYWEYDYPALMITDTAFFRNPNYHTKHDRWLTLDYKRMAEVVNGVSGVLMDF